MKSKSGFTIVEVLVVVIIISVLTGLSILGYQNIQRDQRDTKRVADIKVMENELKKYYEKNGEYPPYLTDPSGFLEDLYTNKNVKDPLDNSATAQYRIIAGSHYCGLSSQLFWQAGFCTNYIYFSFNGSGTSGFSDTQMGCKVELYPEAGNPKPAYVIVWYSETRQSIMFTGVGAVVSYQSAPDSHLPGQTCVLTPITSI